MYWNAIKAGFRLKLGLANPYEIKPEYSLLSKQNGSINVNFLQKQQVSQHDYVFRFALPEEDKCLGLKIGQYVELHLNGNKRPYNPISRIDEPGQVDFLVTDLRKTNGDNSFTNSLFSMKQNDPVELKGPFTQYIYHGYGKLQWPGKSIKKYKHIGIISAGSGITGTYTLIDSLMPNYDNQTGISLLWMGRQIGDFIFMEEFSMLAEQQKLNFNLMLREMKAGWVGPFGPITKQHIVSYMPPSGPDTVIIIIGCSTQDIKRIVPLLEQLNHNNILLPVL